jgi:putative hydrolase of HD superfamily
MKRLHAKIDFLLTCDRLKAVQRTTCSHDGSRPENSAEQSWHLALMALTLSGYAPTGVDVGHFVRLLLIHDPVKIGAGHLHFAAEQVALENQSEAEERAAQALLALLPPDQQLALQAQREEFEAQRTPEARFARALDALQPVWLTWAGGGVGGAE